MTTTMPPEDTFLRLGETEIGRRLINMMESPTGVHKMTDSPHVVRYRTSVDFELRRIPDADDRRQFLRSELTKWEARYADFQQAVDAGGAHAKRAMANGVCAADFVITIADLHARLKQQDAPALQAAE